MSLLVQARARHAEVDPAVTEHVEGRGGLGDVDRVVEREDAACRADPHTLGARGDRPGHRERRREQQRSVAEMALRQHDRVEAELLAAHDLVEDRLVVAPARAHDEAADPHRSATATALCSLGCTPSTKRSIDARQRSCGSVK